MKFVELEITRRCLLTCAKCPKMVQSRKEVMGDNHYPIPFLYTDDSQIMIVGLAPGRMKADHPLSGNDEYAFKMGSGKVLFKALTTVGIELKYFHITNIIKCTTPEDNVFDDFDVRVCAQSYLIKEIDIINPLLIIVLGNNAKELFNKHVLNSIDTNIKVDYLYHPAAVQRGAISYETFYNKLVNILEHTI